ncbi:hypothetical protein ACIHDR_13605 [Nocardia sp. NPDC052278]|uniref:AMP-binding enzyme n=1 Tax=unclassified Nocardia TaxID=2637762 RepID=UPI00369AB2BA
MALRILSLLAGWQKARATCGEKWCVTGLGPLFITHRASSAQHLQSTADRDQLAGHDRKKDIIVRGGESISAKEVEDVLAQHLAVAEAAAVGLPDERYGERVCAVVVLRTDCALNLDEIGKHFVGKHFARTGLARQKTPERLVIVDQLPRTAAGKVQKFVLRERMRGRR